MRHVDLNLLIVLDAMFVERQVTRVAERLSMSQPAVSHALNKLRQSFDDDLFVREGSKMQPTPVAEALRDPIRQVLQIVSNEIARERSFDPGTSERRFTLCLSDIGELVFLPKLLEVLEKNAPNATLRCVAMPPRELERAMAEGQVDIALGYFPDLTGDAFYQQKLFEHRFGCIARKGHPKFKQGVTLEQFLAADHAVVTSESRSQEIFEKFVRDKGMKRKVLLQSQHFMSTPFLVATTDMIATVPRAVGRAYCRVAPLELLDPPIEVPAIELRQHWHRRVHRDAAIVWLRRIISGLYLNNDPSEVDDDPIFGLSPR